MRDRDPGQTIAVYMMASRRNGTLYTGMTSNLVGRVWQHRKEMTPGFASQYGCKTLVWYERQDTILGAIAREKSIKTWRRAWKLSLIEAENPQWLDLARDWYRDAPTELPGAGVGPLLP